MGGGTHWWTRWVGYAAVVVDFLKALLTPKS